MSKQLPPPLPGLIPWHKGKTRDTYLIPGDEGTPARLLVVASDRLSTHNIVHESLIPKKGEVLTALTVFWLTQVLDHAGFHHHLLMHGARIYDYLSGDREEYPADLHLRAIIVEQFEMVLVEFVFRAYLAGSLYAKFVSKGIENPYGVEIPRGMPLMARFHGGPIFTPTEKSDDDDPIHAFDVVSQYPDEFELASQVFDLVREHLNARGIEMVDSKFEIGITPTGEVALGDEVATPDSSRFCELSEIQEGVEPKWLDKQIARDEAQRIWGDGPKYPLEFSDEVITSLQTTYLNVFERITGMSLEEFQHRYMSH